MNDSDATADFMQTRRELFLNQPSISNVSQVSYSLLNIHSMKKVVIPLFIDLLSHEYRT